MNGHTVAAAPASSRMWGLLAEFESVDALLKAVEKVRDAGYVKFDAFAPFPIHGLDEGMGIRMSKLPWFVALGGLTGTATALLLQWYTNGFDYKFMISAKPFFGLPSVIPITFELTVLFASIGAFLGLMATNRLPELHHPVFPSGRFRERATTDAFFVGIEAADPTFDANTTRVFLQGLGAVRVDEVED